MRVSAPVLLVACSVIGLLIGAAWPPPPVPRNLQGENAWNPPSNQHLERFSKEAFASASEVRWMGDENDAGPAEAADTAWRLAGFVEKPEPQALIIRTARPRAAERLAAGGPLPDGSRLTDIDDDTITVERHGCRLVYQLYRDQPVSSSGTCETQEDDGEKEVP